VTGGVFIKVLKKLWYRLRFGKPTKIDFEMEDDFMNFVFVEYRKDEDTDDYSFVFHFDERYDIEELYAYLEGALFSLECMMDILDFEQIEKVNNSKKKKKAKGKSKSGAKLHVITNKKDN